MGVMVVVIIKWGDVMDSSLGWVWASTDLRSICAVSAIEH